MKGKMFTKGPKGFSKSFKFGNFDGMNCCGISMSASHDHADWDIDIEDGYAIGGFRRKTYQKIIDGTLHVYFLLAGVDKTNINLRAKPDTIVLEAKIAEKFVDVIGDRDTSLRIKLKEEIHADQIKATFSDGVLMVQAPIADPMQDIEVEDVED